MKAVTGPAARQGERRLPMALAVAVAAGLYLVLPPDFRLTEAAVWAYPAFLLGLLVVLILGDPGRIDRERRWLRVIAYALWYWQLDSGGPAARANGTLRGLPAFRFPEHSLDDPAYAEWYPQFVDYLALSFSTGTAFGPTDVSAVRHWSKLWLISESALSLAIIGLVVARAINEL